MAERKETKDVKQPPQEEYSNMIGSVKETKGDNTAQGKRRKEIFDTFKPDAKMTELDLSNCKVSDVEVKTVADFLKTNRTVVKINLHYNQIGPAGCALLCDAIKDNPTLTTIDLSWNQIGDDGCTAVTDCLKQNKKIVVFAIHSNKFDMMASVMDPIHKRLKENAALAEEEKKKTGQ